MTRSDEKRIGVAEARQNLTELVAEVRLLKKPAVLTRREKPQAVVVSVDFYEQALADRARLESLET